MERCPNCGSKLSKIDVLCPKCAAVVEVIQIKSSISLNPETEKQTNPDSENTIKKDFPEAFIVYNEDFPVEETGGVSDAADAAEDEALQDVPSVTGSKEPEAQIDEPFDFDPPVITQPEPQDIASYENIEDAGTADIEYDNDYSARYLEHLKNINLPEIDDMQSFDPEEFMHEYRRNKEAQAESPLNEAPADEQLLNTEEQFEAEEPTAADEIEQITHSTETATIERRYRSAETKNKARAHKAPKERAKQKKPGIAVSVLLWLVVSAAFFVGFMFFDGYVQKAYGSYNSFIYTITDGKIDLEPGN